MKTKEEVIKEAWGDIYNDQINKDGWFTVGFNYEYNHSDFDTIRFLYCVQIRPKSLQGIEDNNGWIRIESKDDLPIDNGGSYMVCEKGIPREEYQMPRESLAKGWACGVITHYKPIVKHKKTSLLR